jgi:hypothetical protein
MGRIFLFFTPAASSPQLLFVLKNHAARLRAEYNSAIDAY